MTALLPAKPAAKPAGKEPSTALADAGQESVVHRRRGSLVMRSTDEGNTGGAFYTPVVPESDGESPGLTPTSRLKEKLRRSLRLQVAVGMDLVSAVEQYKGTPRNRNASVSGPSPTVIKSRLVEGDTSTPNCSPFACYMAGVADTRNPLAQGNPRARFWKIVSDHGWTDHQVAELRKSFLTCAVLAEGQSEAKLTFEGFEKLLPELLRIDRRDILAARVRRFWTYLDMEQKGEVNFEDFFMWYLKYMHTELDRSKPINGTNSPAARFPISPSELIKRPEINDHKSFVVKRSGTKSLTSRRTVDF